MNAILQRALENVPEGYEVIKRGTLRTGDKIWNGKTFVTDEHFIEVRVNVFTCVIRPIKTETTETKETF